MVSRPSGRHSPTTSRVVVSWAAPAASTGAARRSSTWGGVRDRRHGSPGSATPWSWSVRRPRAWLRWHGAGALAKAGWTTTSVCHVLARVRAGRQGADHRPPVAGAPGRFVRLRREGRPRRRFRPRSPRRDHGAAAAGVGAGRTAGLSRDQSRLLRRRAGSADRPAHRSLGQFFHEEIAEPLGLEFYIRVRRASRRPPGTARAAGFWPMTTLPLRSTLGCDEPRSSVTGRWSPTPGQASRRSAPRRRQESGGALGEASERPAASPCVRGVRQRRSRAGTRAETMESLEAPAIPSGHGFFDECFHGPAKFSLGFMKPERHVPSGAARSARPGQAARWDLPTRMTVSATAT